MSKQQMDQLINANKGPIHSTLSSYYQHSSERPEIVGIVCTNLLNTNTYPYKTNHTRDCAN